MAPNAKIVATLKKATSASKKNGEREKVKEGKGGLEGFLRVWPLQCILIAVRLLAVRKNKILL
jgi:hypothetical protein